MLDEHFRVKGRTKGYESVDEMQVDLNSYLKDYNEMRPHQGRGMNGLTPYRVFKAGIKRQKPRNERVNEEAA